MSNISQMAGRLPRPARALDLFSTLRSDASCRVGYSQLRSPFRADGRLLLQPTLPKQRLPSRFLFTKSSKATSIALRNTEVDAAPQPHANRSSHDTGDGKSSDGEEEDESMFSTLILVLTYSMPFLAVQGIQKREATRTIELDAPRIRPGPEYGGHRLPIRGRCFWDCTSGNPIYTMVDEAWGRDIGLWNTSTDLRKGADLMARFHFRTSPMANSHLARSEDVGSEC